MRTTSFNISYKCKSKYTYDCRVGEGMSVCPSGTSRDAWDSLLVWLTLDSINMINE